MPAPPAIPLSVKLLYSAWFALWVPTYWAFNGPLNFLWLCDVANWLLLAALWSESALLLSAQAVGVLAIQALWVADFLGRLLAGVHPIGGTEYMFESGEPLWVRSCSLFHLWVPLLLLWALARVGYDRRAPWLQTLVAWGVLAASWRLGDAERNLNWLWHPFGVAEPSLPPGGWLLVAMAACPLVLYWPTHRALAAWDARRRAGSLRRPS